MKEKSPASVGVATPIIKPELRSREASAALDAEGDWLCLWCHNSVANEQDRFRYQDIDEFTFTNPEGMRFHILTFSRTPGCCQTGVPTLEYTWFPGHAWVYCQCDQCGQHLGWSYAGKYHFSALIRTRIIRGLWLRN